MAANAGWERLKYSFAEYIPGYGTYYSIQRSKIGQQVGDDKMHWASAVNAIQGTVRDIILHFKHAEPISVVVIHAIAESFSDNWVDLMTDNTRIDTNYQLKGQPPRGKDHTNVLITGKTKEDTDQVLEHKLNHPKFLSALRLHKAVYLGKLKFDTYSTNENFFLVFPEGLCEGGACYALSTFTFDAGGAQNRPITSISPRIRKIGSLKFEIKSDGSTPEYYWFAGTVLNQGQKIDLEMRSPKEWITTIHLERQYASIT
ncbi:hypothetical protein BDV93DRAFT_561145 [Ceratobasidium sp. AG-I]|nr:hypothetical protein BDV93DRAFT_561145 [Ceratobasidium sp. AG-I]